MKQSQNTLALPDLRRPPVAVYPAVQINMNVLTNENWIETIAEVVGEWLVDSDFSESGTLWSITQKTVDFGRPVLAEFVLPHGLPGMGEYLLTKLAGEGRNAALWSSIFFLGQEAWRPFCHVEQGKVWLEAENKVGWKAYP